MNNQNSLGQTESANAGWLDPLVMRRVEPQPNIQGSYIGDGEKWHYCEMGDMDRVGAKEDPKWKTIINPFGAQGDLRKNGEEWVWVAPHNVLREPSGTDGSRLK
jgi:hypothetical protein